MGARPVPRHTAGPLLIVVTPLERWRHLDWCSSPAAKPVLAGVRGAAGNRHYRLPMVEYVGGPRTREALAGLLEQQGFRRNSYHLYGARLDDAIILDQRPQGWVVFYSERGGEYDLRAHRTEADACDDALNRLWRDASFRQ